MSQEKTQIFRGDDAPEMGIADTDEATPARRSSGPADQRALSDSKEGQQGERREMRDASDGLTEQRRTNDAEGASNRREMHDAEGLSEQRAIHDADGLSELRQLHDHKVALPGEAAGKAEVRLNFNDDAPEPEAVAAIPEPAEPVVAPPSPQDDADLTFKAEDDATPWALSIHLEERIANLGMVTAKVNEQLDRLEASTQRLGKRVGK